MYTQTDRIMAGQRHTYKPTHPALYTSIYKQGQVERQAHMESSWQIGTDNGTGMSDQCTGKGRLTARNIPQRDMEEHTGK